MVTLLGGNVLNTAKKPDQPRMGLNIPAQGNALGEDVPIITQYKP
jgi:hypothetical protein